MLYVQDEAEIEDKRETGDKIPNMKRSPGSLVPDFKAGGGWRWCGMNRMTCIHFMIRDIDICIDVGDVGLVKMMALSQYHGLCMID